jgi:hypothetical protein
MYRDTGFSFSEDMIKHIKENYKIINVDYLHPVLVKSKMNKDIYFSSPNKKKIVDDMLDYYSTHKDKELYERVDYLCDMKEKICICNTHAGDLRKIYEGINYKPNETFVSWISKK